MRYSDCRKSCFELLLQLTPAANLLLFGQSCSPGFFLKKSFRIMAGTSSYPLALGLTHRDVLRMYTHHHDTITESLHPFTWKSGEVSYTVTRVASSGQTMHDPGAGSTPSGVPSRHGVWKVWTLERYATGPWQVANASETSAAARPARTAKGIEQY